MNRLYHLIAATVLSVGLLTSTYASAETSATPVMNDFHRKQHEPAVIM